MSTQSCKIWYEKSYRAGGSSAQRKYPNEELCRFLGRHFSQNPTAENSRLHCLEVGCGSGGNLWTLAEYGFNVTGLDLSPTSLKFAEEQLESRGMIEKVKLVESCMTSMPFSDSSFNILIDCFSSYCLSSVDFEAFLSESFRVLLSGSKVFFYTPAKSSDAFVNSMQTELVDRSTLNGITREDSPFYGNAYPFRFEDPAEFIDKLSAAGLILNYLEIVSKTYNGRREKFDWITCEAMKP